MKTILKNNLGETTHILSGNEYIPKDIFEKEEVEKILTKSETNTVIAALMLASLLYEGNKEHPLEAERYKAVETKLRKFCYERNKEIHIR